MIIDCHTHIFPPEMRDKREDFFDNEPAFKCLYGVQGSRLAGVEDIITSMDEAGVDTSIVFGFPWQTEDYFKKNNDYIIEAVERYKHRLIGFSTFSPIAEGAAREAERCLEVGLSGLGELAFYVSPINNEAMRAFEPVATIAGNYDVPILLHTNESIGHHYPGKSLITLREIFDFLKHFQDNKMVLAHWGGGIFFYNIMKKGVKDVLKNVWFDTAASPYLYENKVYSLAEKIIGADRILFGSDFPLLKPGRYFKEMKEAGLSDDAMKKICGENAASLLKQNIKSFDKDQHQ